MNRPIKPTVEDDLTFEDFMCASGKWEKDIQEYCDELERYIKSLENAYDISLNTSRFWEDNYWLYKKAFDKLMRKTYELLISNKCERCPCRFDCDELQYLKGGKQNLNYLDCYKQLKEWSMKDD